MERLAHTHTDDRSELLSAYIDNAVDVVERRRAEEFMEACTACAQEVRELRMFKQLLGELPMVQPPRSFTLDPHSAPRPRWLLFPTLRLASVLSAVLLLVVLGVDGLSSARSGTNSPAAAMSSEGPSMGKLEEVEGAAELQESAAAAAEAAPMFASAAAAVGAAPPPGADTGGVTAMGGAAPTEIAGADTTRQGAGAAGTTGATAGGDAGAAGEAGAAGTAGEAQGPTASEADDTAAANTVTLDQDPAAVDNATPSSFDTTLVVELVLALAAVAFGVGALVARRRGI